MIYLPGTIFIGFKVEDVNHGELGEICGGG